SGVVIIPGSSERSRLYQLISGSASGPKMPPTGPLKAEEIGAIKTWIDDGAKWPDEPAREPAWKVEPRMAALLSAVREGRFSAVKNSPELINARSAKGTTLLMQAALYGTADDVNWLLEHGADPHLAGISNVTA